MKRFCRGIDRINEQTGKLISLFIIILVAVILYEICARYLFNRPTIWAQEISQMIYGAYVILLGGYVLQRGGHVNVEILYGRFRPRTKAIIDLFTWLLFFFFCGLILVKGWDMAWDSFKVRETEPTSFAPPVYPIKMMIPLGALLLLLQGLAKFLRTLALAISGKEVES
ncbi:MAG: TRAP transporter small permease subunit [Deltaproteobacteria bacterium]|nr:TRAP transporter small permease subunit [Deltaproteobacteria bacterium]